MKLGKIVGIIVVVLVVALGGTAAYLSTLDVDEYRPEIAQAAKDATGRDLTLEGPLSLSISLTPTISGEGISFANAPWGTRPQMLTLRRFEMQLRLVPLLFGNIQIRRLVLVEPDIFLETNAKGLGNWQFGPGTAAPAKGTGVSGNGGNAGNDVVPHVGRLSIEKGQMTYLNGATGTVIKVDLKSVEADAASADDPLNLKIQAAFNGMAVTLDGSVGPLKNILSPVNPTQADLTAKGLGLTIKIKGTGKATAGTLDARIDVAAKTLSGLRAFAGDALPANVPLKLSVHATAEAGKINLSELRLSLGKSDLAGNIAIDTTAMAPKISADLTGKRLDLNELQAAKNSGEKSSAAKSSSAKKASARAGKVLPADPLPLDGLKLAEADVRMAIGEVVTPYVTLKDVGAVVQLTKSHLALKPLEFTLAGSPVSITASVNGAAKVPTVSLNLAAPTLDIGRLLTEAKATDLLQGSGDLNIKLAGQGRSIAAIAGSLNGGTNLLMTEGKVKTDALDMAVGGLSALVGMMTSDKSEWTVLNCVASRFDIKKGVATSLVLLADTEYSTVVGEGSLDLGAETLAMKVSPQSKSATLNLAVPIKIGGTFADPTFRPDELATARRLGGLLGATLFPPAALLALGDMGSSDDHPCLKIAAGGTKKSAAQTKQPAEKSATEPAAETAAEAVKAPLESLTKSLGSLFGSKK